MSGPRSPLVKDDSAPGGPRGLLDLGGKPGPIGFDQSGERLKAKPTPAVGQKNTLAELPAPNPILFPPAGSHAVLPNQASQNPALMPTLPTGSFFGDPPTRIQTTTGTVLSAQEISDRKALCAVAISEAKPVFPMAADNFQYWLNGTAVAKVMPSTVFSSQSDVKSFLKDKALEKFKTGIKNRLKSAAVKDSMVPTPLTPGAKGPVIFLQFEDAPSFSLAYKITDLFFALGSFNVHSAIWAQATYKGNNSHLIGPNTNDYSVEILKWYVQIYDVYDWNKKTSAGAADTTIIPLIGKAAVEKFKLAVPNPIPGVEMSDPWPHGTHGEVKISDQVFLDMEVTGTGRAFLVRCEAFEAEAGLRATFDVKIEVS